MTEDREKEIKEMMDEAKITLTVEQAADRVLTVLCAMTGGDTQVAVSKHDLMAECRRLKILWMSESEFNEYLQKTQQTLGARNN